MSGRFAKANEVSFPCLLATACSRCPFMNPMFAIN